jgi:ABC-type lipoprotein release transport system permease subunit
MRVVLMRVRTLLRRNRWTSTAAVVVIIVAAGATLVLALVGGARRTATAPDRFTEVFGGGVDVAVVQPAGPPLVDEFAALDQVKRVASLTFVAASPAGPESDSFAGDALFPGDRILDGRLPAPSAPHEFVANQFFVEQYDLRVGDRRQFSSLDQDQIDRNAYVEEPAGLAFEGTLVGVVGGLSTLDDPVPTALFSAALLGEDVGQLSTLLFVDLAADATADELLAAARGLPGGEELSIQYDQLVSDSLRDSVQAQATGVWVVAGVCAVAVVVTVGQLLVRQLRRREAERVPLRALGYTSRQLVSESVLAAAVLIVIGVAVGVLAAAAVSGVFPIGFARGLEPAPGFRLDPVALVAGSATLAAALLLWVVAGSIASLRPTRPARGSATAQAIARSGISPAAATGARFALSKGGDGNSFATTVAALSFAVAGVLGTVVFASSMSRLVADGDRHGQNFDLVIGNGFQPSPVDLAAALDDDPAVDGLMVLSGTTARVQDDNVNIVGVDAVRGGLVPRVLAGRFPVSGDEVALGRITADQLDVGVGDEVTFYGTASSASYQVVGYVVVPTFYFGRGVGHGAAMLGDGLQRVVPGAQAAMAAIRLAPGSRPTDVREVADLASTPADELELPADVRNLERIRAVPMLLAVVLAALATLTLAHNLATSIRSRTRDVAVLRTLGADRRWLGATVHWQAATLVAAALAVGVPAGLLAGRLAFRTFGDRIGAASDPLTPPLPVLAIILAAIVVANIAAAIPARRVRRQPTATLLHAE